MVSSRNLGRPGEDLVRLLAVAKLAGEGKVAACFRIYQRGFGLERIAGFNRRIQRLPIDIHQFGRIAGLRHAVGDDAGNGVADMAHDALAQHGNVAVDALAAIGLRYRRLGRQRLQMSNVDGGEHEVDTPAPARRPIRR